MEITIKAGTFKLMNMEKVQRIIEGTTSSKGEIVAGLGEEALTEQPELVIALYDKLGGWIQGKEGQKVKMGSFYDFKKRGPRAKPEIVYTFRVNGERIEMAEGEALPLEVQAANLADQVKKKKATKKVVSE